MSDHRPGRPGGYWDQEEYGAARTGAQTGSGQGTGHPAGPADGGGYHGDGGHYDEAHYGDGHYDEAHYGDGHYDEAHYDDGHYDQAHYEDGHYGDGSGGEGWPAVSASGAPSYRRPRPDRRTGRRRHPVLVALALIVVLIVVVVGGGLLYAEQQINPGGKPGPLVSVVIPAGATTRQIGSDLASAGVIHNGTIFAYYVKVTGDGPLLPGTYQLARNESYTSAINSLKNGPKIITENLTIPEGYTLRQIAERVGALPHIGISAAAFLQAAQSGSVRSPYEPPGTNSLEGLLFPATYTVKAGESATDLLYAMVGAFNDRANQIGLTAAAAKLGRTPYQVITVASIIEREAKIASDRGPVASAIYNRLRIGMKLGADSTQTYYLRLTDPTIEPTPAQLDQPSPYNTRTNTGLPPTPISNPGLASLQAASAPPTTTYLYFVETNPDGKLSFASTNAGFDDLQRQCRAVGLC